MCVCVFVCVRVCVSIYISVSMCACVCVYRPWSRESFEWLFRVALQSEEMD